MAETNLRAAREAAAAVKAEALDLLCEAQREAWEAMEVWDAAEAAVVEARVAGRPTAHLDEAATKALERLDALNGPGSVLEEAQAAYDEANEAWARAAQRHLGLPVRGVGRPR